MENINEVTTEVIANQRCGMFFADRWLAVFDRDDNWNCRRVFSRIFLSSSACGAAASLSSDMIARATSSFESECWFITGIPLSFRLPDQRHLWSGLLILDFAEREQLPKLLSHSDES